ncbi:MAG: tyrosine recombinase [Proteobacteria bacterium]|nr:tyrosine recombinase [Pseudomonadota bacterium]
MDNKIDAQKFLQIATLISNFVEMLAAERFCANNTILAYKSDLVELAEYIGVRDVDLHNVSNKDIILFIEFIVEKGRLKRKTVARKISAMRQFFQFLISEGFMNYNPALDIDMPKPQKSIPKAISRDLIERILDAVKIDENKEGIRASAILEILYATGMRISELLSLKIDALQKSHLESGEIAYFILVRGKGDKERIIPLHKDALDALDKYLKVREGFAGQKSMFLFPSQSKEGKITHLTRQRFGQILKDIASQCGIDKSIVSPHKIRHSFATHMLQNGANLRILQEILGHSDISSTQIYTEVRNSDAENLVFSKHPLQKLQNQ